MVRCGVVVLAAGALLFAGCTRSSVCPPGSSAAPGSIRVEQPRRRILNRVVEQPGTIEAYEVAQRYARVPGYVHLPYDAEGRLLIDIGREVRGPKCDTTGKETEPGQVLAEVEVPELVQQAKLKRAVVEQTKADVEQAEKFLAATTAAVAVAEAAVMDTQAAHDFWQTRAKKFAGLVEGGTLDAQSRDEADKQFQSAAAKLAAAKAVVIKAKADRDKAEADVKSVKARVAVADADARSEEAMLSYATIRAPFDGIVTRRKVNNGDLVQPGGKDDWLFTIARMDLVRVVVAVPEMDAELVRQGQEVNLTVQALTGPALSGNVARTSWDLEPSSRTLRTEIDLPNKDHVLRPGMFARARITCPLQEAWTLPASAVAKQDAALVCFRIVDGKAVWTPVQVGRGDGQFIQVLKYQTSGSSPSWEAWTGTESIAAQATGLTDGQAVQVESNPH